MISFSFRLFGNILQARFSDTISFNAVWSTYHLCSGASGLVQAVVLLH